MMAAESCEETSLLPHHEQLPLCTSRLPYRQGRKLTAVKAYTINNESNHLLIFGVPSLNLRQEAKSLCLPFGQLTKFYASKDHPGEAFTETYHARYDRIQSARVAKRMLDTKNFYGGVLHVCYAPELETLQETRSKLIQRSKDVKYRLRNIQREFENKDIEKKDMQNIHFQENISTENISIQENSDIVNEIKDTEPQKINMGEANIIYLNKRKRKTVAEKVKSEKRNKTTEIKDNIEIVDCSNTNKEVISNINEALNYNKFGNEVIRKIEEKPMNKIIFAGNKKTL